MSPTSPDNWLWRSAGATPGRAVVFDMDGVLSDANHRQHFLERPRRDWDAFFAACGDDPLLEDVAHLLQVIEGDLQIVLLTARPIAVQAPTLAWLERHDLRWDLLIMRQGGSYEASRDFKRRSVGELREAGFELSLAFEDDIRNAEMLRSEGIPCIYVHSGYYE